jgi:gliding motility-associated-like protein
LTKVYDGTPNVNVISNSSSGTISSDNVAIQGSATNFSDKIVGNNYTSTVTFNLITIPYTGKENNYYITGSNPVLITNGSITKLPITLTASTNTKVYDGTVSATATPTLTGTLASGDVGVYSETYDTKNQGTNKVLTPTGTILDATSASVIGNYSITYATNTSGSITKLPITLTASTNTKVYDGTISATATPTITNGALVSGDVGTYSETYDTKSQGTNKVLTPSVISILDATNASMTGNYSITYGTNTSGSITKLPITLTASANTKVYDGTVIATATPTLTGTLVSGDVGVYSETYDTKSQGASKALTPTGTILDATNTSMTGNYSITYASINTGVITVRSITISATVLDKQYDGNTTATATLTDNRVSGDVLTVNKTGATFNDKNIGSGKTVTVAGITLTGTDAGNYTLTSSTGTGTASITVKSLTISATILDKQYDGNTTATANLTDNRVTGDVITVNKTGATFNNKNIGVDKAVTITGVTLTGTDAGNYTITSSTATGTASITVKSLTITATATDKEYDGNTTATATLTDNRISGDVLTVNKTGATFNNKNIGTGKAVTVSGITLTGTDAGNYSLTNKTATGTASITAKNLIITAIAKNKPYDGNKIAEVTLSDDKIVGDIITSSYTLAEFDTKEIGDNKIVTVKGISIQGLDALNYILTNTIATANANIIGIPEVILVLPNAFTPNGDNNNDEFKVVASNTLGKTSFKSLEIYNRNGKLMFRTEDISKGWNGRSGDVLQDMGVYFVKLVKLNKDGQLVVETSPIYLLK